MPFYFFLWDEAVVEHLAEHDVTPAEFEEIVQWSRDRGTSASSGRPLAGGFADDGRLIICVYELIDETTVLPITAYEPTEK
jgi:uncharacterized DUF497 family protein